jgi:radical SAM superfamily enzyme YgiQ (UPF0313 family)
MSPKKFEEFMGTLPDKTKSIEFNDETFALDYKRTLDICNIMKKWGGVWGAESRIDVISRNPELLKIMRDSGLTSIGFGIESANRKIRKSQSKDFDNKEAKNIIQTCKDLGITTGSYFILGHPNETFFSAIRTILLAFYIGADNVSFGIMIPFPGTLVREMALKGEGGYTLTHNDWSFYSKQYGHALEFKKVSHISLEIIQIIGYFLFCFRNPIKKAKYAWSRRLQIWFMINRLFAKLKKQSC